MTRRRTVPHRSDVSVFATSTPLVLEDADLLPDDGGSHLKSSPSRTSSHRYVVPVLAISMPLVLDYADLLPNNGGCRSQILWRDVEDAISHVLAAHPGPFQCVRLW
uniref:Uncharacterized protein n=1 Tax=Oryza nivara TaxID=4536 RepID=A0A0E0J502_ORYNI